MSRKGPYLPWFPKDIMSDVGLQGLTNSAFGLWHKLLYIMWSGEPYGHLSVNGQVIPEDKLARMCWTDRAEFAELMTELEAAGVFSRTPAGIIFSRRMVRDAQRSETARKNGAIGGNPALRSSNSRITNRLTKQDKGEDIPFLGIYILVLISGSGSEGKGSGETDPHTLRSPHVGDAMQTAWLAWCRNLEHKGMLYESPAQAEAALAMLADFDTHFAVDLLTRAAGNRWNSFVFPDTKSKYLELQKGPPKTDRPAAPKSQGTVQRRGETPKRLADYLHEKGV